MSLYLIVGLLLAILSIMGLSERFESISYYSALIVLILFLAVRFGQGTDWLSYNYIFSSAPSTIDFSSPFYSELIHSEIGWKLINNVWKTLGLDFQSLSIVLSIIEMVLLDKFIRAYVPNSSLSLLIAFPVVYLTIFFSLFRQAVVVAVYLGIMIELLEKNKLIQYIVITLLLCMVHSMALILFLPMIASRMKVRTLTLVLFLSICIGVISIFLLPKLIVLLGLNYSGNGLSLIALLYRCAMAFLVFLLWGQAKKQGADLRDCELLIKVYICGLCVYLLFMGNDLYASRLASPMLGLEIVLIPILVQRGFSNSSILLLAVIIAVCAIMTLKNIGSYIDQGYYRNNITIMNYPYVSIFNKEDLFLYSESPLLLFVNT